MWAVIFVLMALKFSYIMITVLHVQSLIFFYLSTNISLIKDSNTPLNSSAAIRLNGSAEKLEYLKTVTIRDPAVTPYDQLFT